MKRLEDKIEKRFGDGIEYKGIEFDNIHSIDENYLRIQVIATRHWNALSINDLCSPECDFSESLERTNNENRLKLNPYIESIGGYEDTIVSYDKLYSGLDYHRMQLSLLNDEDKILYILQNTKDEKIK